MREILYNLIIPLGSLLRLEWIHRLGGLIGMVMWAVLPGRRREAARCIEERLEVDGNEALRLAQASFRHSACSFLEIFHSRGVDPRFLRERLEFENPELFARLAASTRPIVGVTGHLGAWELLVGLIGVMNKSEGQVVVRLPKDEALGRLILHMRSQSHVRVLPHRDAARETLGQLRRGGICAFLVDHNCRRAEAQFLPFLGQVAAVNKGPAILALRAKAEVWPFFLIRLPAGRFRAVTLPCLDTTMLTGSRAKRVEKICRFYTEAVESMVRQYPEQWFWMHRRWKTRP